MFPEFDKTENFYRDLARDLAHHQRSVRLGRLATRVESIHPGTFATTALGRRIPEVLHVPLLDLTDEHGIPYFRGHYFGRGEAIIREGELGREMFMLVQGTAEIKAQDEHTIARMNPGDCFGELAVLSSERLRMASAEASSRCFAISVDAAFTELDGRLKLIFKNAMLDIVEEKLYSAYDEIKRLKQRRQRVRQMPTVDR